MENIASIKDGDMDYLVWTMLSFSLDSIIAHLVWTLLPLSRKCVNEIMESIASVIDRDMDYLVWTTPSFEESEIVDYLIGTMLSFQRNLRHELLGLNFVVFLYKTYSKGQYVSMKSWRNCNQKQPPGVTYRCQSLFFNKVAGLRPEILFKKWL